MNRIENDLTRITVITSSFNQAVFVDQADAPSADGAILFSTIIPVFNRSELVCKAVESALTQEFGSQEIIVVDDGSSDDTVRVLERFGDRIRILRQTNRGPGAARNLGIEHARGTYIAFLDSDDYWLPWTLSTYAQAIEDNRQPAMLAGLIHYFANADGSLDLDRSEVKVRSFSDYLSAGGAGFYMGAGQAVIRADVLRKCGGFVSERVNAEDHDLTIRLGDAGKFVAILAPAMVACRLHNGSASASVHNTYLGLRLLISREIKGEYPGGKARQRERRTIISRHARPAAMDLAKHRNLVQAWDLYRRTLKWHLNQRRFRFVAAFPFVLLWQAVRTLAPRPAPNFHE